MSDDFHPDFIPVFIERLIPEERLKRVAFREKWGFAPQHLSPVLENIDEVLTDYQNWKRTHEKLAYYVEINTGCSASGVGPSGDGR
ncbi:MAG: hypothetical protein HZC17_07995 [Candidatus Omnitrophica bacterium]|nr:hypothetical protein [Candidatus Omnitrophota bacterium]